MHWRASPSFAATMELVPLKHPSPHKKGASAPVSDTAREPYAFVRLGAAVAPPQDKLVRNVHQLNVIPRTLGAAAAVADRKHSASDPSSKRYESEEEEDERNSDSESDQEEGEQQDRRMYDDQRDQQRRVPSSRVALSSFPAYEQNQIARAQRRKRVGDLIEWVDHGVVHHADFQEHRERLEKHAREYLVRIGIEHVHRFYLHYNARYDPQGHYGPEWHGATLVVSGNVQASKLPLKWGSCEVYVESSAPGVRSTADAFDDMAHHAYGVRSLNPFGGSTVQSDQATFVDASISRSTDTTPWFARPLPTLACGGSVQLVQTLHEHHGAGCGFVVSNYSQDAVDVVHHACREHKLTLAQLYLSKYLRTAMEHGAAQALAIAYVAAQHCKAKVEHTRVRYGTREDGSSDPDVFLDLAEPTSYSPSVFMVPVDIHDEEARSKAPKRLFQVHMGTYGDYDVALPPTGGKRQEQKRDASFYGFLHKHGPLDGNALYRPLNKPVSMDRWWESVQQRDLHPPAGTQTITTRPPDTMYLAEPRAGMPMSGMYHRQGGAQAGLGVNVLGLGAGVGGGAGSNGGGLGAGVDLFGLGVGAGAGVKGRAQASSSSSSTTPDKQVVRAAGGTSVSTQVESNSVVTTRVLHRANGNILPHQISASYLTLKDRTGKHAKGLLAVQRAMYPEEEYYKELSMTTAVLYVAGVAVDKVRLGTLLTSDSPSDVFAVPLENQTLVLGVQNLSMMFHADCVANNQQTSKVVRQVSGGSLLARQVGHDDFLAVIAGGAVQFNANDNVMLVDRAWLEKVTMQFYPKVMARARR